MFATVFWIAFSYVFVATLAFAVMRQHSKALIHYNRGKNPDIGDRHV
jgi:hypothetical protein